MIQEVFNPIIFWGRGGGLKHPEPPPPPRLTLEFFAMKILMLKFSWYKTFINSSTPLPPKINPTTPPSGLTLGFFP